MNRLQTLANQVSGVIGFAAPTYFAWTVYRDGIPQNVATWLMILCLNCLGLILVYREGNTKPFMQIGWLTSAVCVLAAILLGDSPWHWGMIETLCLLLAVIAVLLWWLLSARIALVAYMVAFFVAGIPLIIDYWYVPQPQTTWLWLTAIGTCLLSIWGAEKQSMASLIVPCGAITENALLVYLCLR